MASMSNIEPAVSRPSRAVLAGYMSEEEYCEVRGCSKRTARAERQRGAGPPWLRLGATIYYPLDGFAAFLKAREVHPVRRMGRPLGGKEARAQARRSAAE
jgi:hypothetical protein